MKIQEIQINTDPDLNPRCQINTASNGSRSETLETPIQASAWGFDGVKTQESNKKKSAGM